MPTTSFMRRTSCPGAVLLALLTVVTFIAGVRHASASCKTPLPSGDLQALDASVDADPLQAIDAARKLIGESGPAAGRRNAELYAIIADAFDTLDDDVEAAAAVAAGRTSLAAADASPVNRDLLLRLELVAADTAQSKPQLTAAVRTLNEWEPALGPTSLGRACLLLVRGRVQSRLNQNELAAKDGMLAHQLAVASGSADAAAEAAYQLGATFRRAGLFEDALRLEDEVIAYARAKRQRAALASALFVKAQTMGAMNEPERGLPFIAESRALSVALKNSTGVAFGDLETCNELLQLKNFDAAERACHDAEVAFRSDGRGDQATMALDLLARMDLEHGRLQAAYSKLSQALADGGRNVPPRNQPTVYRDYAEVLARLGRAPEALAATQKAMRLTEEADLQRRNIAVAVLSAQRKTAIEAQARAALAQELALERDRAASRELTRRLSIGLAVAGILVSTLFSYLLLSSRRHARELRRQEAILRETSMNAPDALVLLDSKGLVRFANRSLFGSGSSPAINQPLTDAGPPEARQAIATAVADLIDRRRAVSADIRLGTADDAQYFELRGNPILDGERLIGATLRVGDVTEIRTLEHEVLAVASKERERLSSDLHEGVGQELTGVSLLLRGAATAVERGHPNVRDLLADSIVQVDRTIAATRDLARGLSPVQVDRGSLSIALERLSLDACRRFKIFASASSKPADIRLPDDISNHLYRIAHEAVSISARASGCTRVSIELVKDEASTRLRVTDDGVRLPADDVAIRLGARTMGYRARLIGGALQFDDEVDTGARMLVTVPHARGVAAAIP
jgi:two-component system, NarL family, sensor histidine kinase UhpB